MNVILQPKIQINSYVKKWNQYQFYIYELYSDFDSLVRNNPNFFIPTEIE